MHISSSYAKISEETVHTREIPQSGSKAKDGIGNLVITTSGGARKAAWHKKLKVGNTNGQPCIANATLGGARKAAWAKSPYLCCQMKLQKVFQYIYLTQFSQCKAVFRGNGLRTYKDNHESGHFFDK